MATFAPRVTFWRRFRAVLLSVVPGSGHLLLGRWMRGAAWLGASLVLGASLPLTGFAGFLLELAVRWAAAVDVMRLPPRREGLPGAGQVLLGVVCFWGVAVVAGSVTRQWLTESFIMPSISMQPTLLRGDHFYADKRRALERGEVIVFNRPGQPELRFVMRVVALGGDTVSVRCGRLHIGGLAAGGTVRSGCGKGENDGPSCEKGEEVLGARRYQILLAEGSTCPSIGDFPSEASGCPSGMELREAGCVVPEGRVFLLGDNRNNAFDSRSWGPLPVEDVVASARFIHFSWSHEDGVRWERLGIPVR